MTTTPSLKSEETLNEMKTLGVSDAEQVLSQWSTYLAHAASSYDQLDTVSNVLKGIARESNAAYTYRNTWEQYQKGEITDQDYCCALFEVLTLLSKARRSWEMVTTLLDKRPEPQEEHYIHEKWYLNQLHKRSRAASRTLADLSQQVQNDLRPFAHLNGIALDFGFMFQVHTTVATKEGVK